MHMNACRPFKGVFQVSSVFRRRGYFGLKEQRVIQFNVLTIIKRSQSILALSVEVSKANISLQLQD